MRLVLLPVLALAVAPLLPASPYTADEKATRDYFRALCDYTVREKARVEVIFTGGYYMRDLVAGHKIFGDKRCLDTAVAYGDWLLGKQSERGQGRVYLGENDNHERRSYLWTVTLDESP